jgi:hypothetical protein
MVLAWTAGILAELEAAIGRELGADRVTVLVPRLTPAWAGSRRPRSPGAAAAMCAGQPTPLPARGCAHGDGKRFALGPCLPIPSISIDLG